MQADVGWVEQELNEVRGDCRVLKKERDEARADYAKLLESSTAVADNLREDIRQLRSQLAAERADRQQVQAQLAELQKRLDEAEQNPHCAIDLSGKAGELVNFFRTLLPKDTKLPKNTMSKLREILEATEN